MNASRSTAPPDGAAATPVTPASAAALSALADGDPDALRAGCEAWRDDPAARATWHAYHLIGDVMRSEELAATPTRDAAFLAALRQRLAAEPVPLAPAPLPAPAASLAAVPRRRHAWLAPAAVAAGFFAVAGALVVTRLSAPEAGAPLQARGPAGSGLTLVGAGAPGAAAPLPMDGRLIRDAQLDRYLEAHRGALGGALAVPGGVKHNVDVSAAPGTPGAVPAAR
jgi:sigma-E factor negative regulatory protein RseA